MCNIFKSRLGQPGPVSETRQGPKQQLQAQSVQRAACSMQRCNAISKRGRHPTTRRIVCNAHAMHAASVINVLRAVPVQSTGLPLFLCVFCGLFPLRVRAGVLPCRASEIVSEHKNRVLLAPAWPHLLLVFSHVLVFSPSLFFFCRFFS